MLFGKCFSDTHWSEVDLAIVICTLFKSEIWPSAVDK